MTTSELTHYDLLREIRRSAEVHDKKLTAISTAVARTDQKVLGMQVSINELKESTKAMEDRQRQLVAKTSEAAGGLKVLRWVFGASVAAGGLAIAWWRLLTE